MEDTSLVVGKEAERFWVNSEADAIWGEIVRIANTTEPIKVPRTAEEMVVFIRDFSNWLARFPAAMCHSNDLNHETLIKDLSLAYIRRHVLRKVVLAVCRALPSNEAFHCLTLSDLSLANCDRGGHVSCLPATTTWGELEHMFGLHPLMISCWACLFADLTEAERTPFLANLGMQFKTAAETLAEEHDGAPPSLRTSSSHISAAFGDQYQST